MGSPANGSVGHAMENLFQLHLGGKRRFRGPKAKVFVKLVRFYKVWPSLVCGLPIVNYIDLRYFLLKPGERDKLKQNLKHYFFV